MRLLCFGLIFNLAACAPCPPGADKSYTCVEVDIALPADCSIACAPSTYFGKE